MYRFTPFAMDQAAIKDATPTNTPSSEKPLLSFWARSV